MPTVIDPAFAQNPNVVPVHIEDSPIPTNVTNTLLLQANGAALYSNNALGPTANGSTGAIATAQIMQCVIMINLSAITGSSPTLTFKIDIEDAFGTWFNVKTETALSAPGTYIESLGPGLTITHDPGLNIRVSWTVGGTISSSTLAITVYGK